MDAEEFWKRISVRSGIHGRDHVIAAAESVFDALRSRISLETGDNIAAQLPAEVKRLWEAERERAEFERMDLEEFLNRVQTQRGLTGPGNASTVVRAVFQTLQEQITPGAADKLASELPGDIREFWLESTPEERPIESPASQRHTGTEGQAQQETRALAEQYEGGDGPELTSMTQEQRRGSPPGEYTSNEIGPSAASIYRSDDQVRSEIEKLLEASDEVDAAEIDVEVRAGHVTLRGVVQSQDQRQAAKRIAHEALGVTEVEDAMQLR